MTEFVSGNRIELLSAGTEFFPALEAACDGAQREIYLETYIFELDPTGRRIGASLMRAAQRGIYTHLLIDGFGSRLLSREYLNELRQAGVRVIIYRPDVSPWKLQRGRLRRLHRKIAMIDGKIAFVGGINIIDDMDTPHQIPPRFDYAVRMQGPLLAQIYPVVTRLWTMLMWIQVRRRWRPYKGPGPDTRPCGTQRAAFVIRDNIGHRNDIEDAYIDAIRTARKEIIIANAYFFPGRSFRRALIEAARRGVKVILLLQGKVEYLLLHYATRALYGRLLAAGIEIHDYHRSFLHAKVAVIDGRWATVGSSNIDPVSLLLAREANVVVDDVGFALKLRTSLEDALKTGAHQVDPAVWNNQSLVSRTITWICYELARWVTGWSSYGRTHEFE